MAIAIDVEKDAIEWLEPDTAKVMQELANYSPDLETVLSPFLSFLSEEVARFYDDNGELNISEMAAYVEMLETEASTSIIKDFAESFMLEPSEAVFLILYFACFSDEANELIHQVAMNHFQVDDQQMTAKDILRLARELNEASRTTLVVESFILGLKSLLAQALVQEISKKEI